MVRSFRFLDDKLCFDYYPEFIEKVNADSICKYLNETIVWPKNYNNKRCAMIYGDSGLKYTVNFSGKILERKTIDWDTLPILKEIRDFVADLTLSKTDYKYNYCVVQRYPSGQFGIKPHRDKEMIPGTKIAGISLGETRELNMLRGTKNHRFYLPSGSLYVFNPPTNDYWSHTIVLNKSNNYRISLTFRNL